MKEINFWDVSILAQPSFWLGTVVFCVISYMIGSVNSGQILSMAGGKNLGNEGSKSYGATNAGRTYGAWAFVLIFLFDVVKVFAIVWILTQMKDGGAPVFEYADINIALIFAIVGHIFPVYFMFRGGKGVATAFGFILSANWILGIAAFLIFITIKIINGWTSLASIFSVGAGVLMVMILQFLFVFEPRLVFNWSLAWTIIPSSFIVGCLVITKHISNLKPMISGEQAWSKNGTIKNDEKI